MGAWFALPCSRRGSKRGATRQRMTAAAADGAKARQRLPGRKAPPPRRPPGGGGKYTDPLTHLTAAPANRKKSLSKKSKPPTQKSDLSNMATYGYIRVSSAGQMDGTSPEEQKRKIDGLAMMRGEELANVFYDGGVSGSTVSSSRRFSLSPDRNSWNCPCGSTMQRVKPLKSRPRICSICRSMSRTRSLSG